MIDTHLHLGQLVLEDPGLTPGKLLRWMDRHGIEKGIVMAVEVPEELDFYLTTKELLKLTRPHRDRLLPLCAVDPRHRYPGSFNPYPILEHYMDQGCVGYGENLCGLPVDDPMQQRVYEACDRLGLAIVMHIDHWINRDETGLPGFERMLKTYGNVKWVGHAQYFWREISAEVGEGERYPEGPVTPGGRLDELFRNNSNLFADLSAQSGYNAITRDPAFGLKFLKRWKHRLMFATDTIHTRPSPACSIVGTPPMLGYIREAGLSKDAVERITAKNAAKVFRIS